MVIGVIKRRGVMKDVAGEKRQEFCEVKKNRIVEDKSTMAMYGSACWASNKRNRHETLRSVCPTRSNGIGNEHISRS